jgi:16S rRNA (uracil1498-N3)-methyltransferase
MRLARIWTTQTLQDTITLDAPVVNRLKRVLRAKVGDCFRMVNPSSGEHIVRIDLLTEHMGIATVLECVRPIEVRKPLWLLQSVFQQKNMDIAIQKATEIGVTRITPIRTCYSAPFVSELKWQRWYTIILNALEQSNRCDAGVTLDATTAWQDIIHLVPSTKFLLHPYAQKRLTSDTHWQSSEQLALMVGPEGGFTPTEVQDAIDAEWQPVCLSNTILRSETASIAALSVIQCLRDDRAIT